MHSLGKKFAKFIIHPCGYIFVFHLVSNIILNLIKFEFTRKKKNKVEECVLALVTCYTFVDFEKFVKLLNLC